MLPLIIRVKVSSEADFMLNLMIWFKLRVDELFHLVISVGYFGWLLAQLLCKADILVYALCLVSQEK